MDRSTIVRTAAGLLGFGVACQPVGALAQAAPDTSSPGLEDVIVTATKRSQRLQETPEAVTAIDASQLAASNLQEPADLSSYAPGLTIAKNEGYNRVVAIRGVGFEAPQNDSALPSVSYHVDGVFIPSPIALNADFLDVSRIEVLRGPQGTVFGQNSTGGAINVINNQPILNQFSGTLGLSYGTYNLVRPTAVLNIPVTDTIAIRGALLLNRHDGFAEATQIAGQPNYPLDDENSFTGRILALWAPMDDLRVRLGVNFFNADENDRGQKNIDDPDPDPRRLTQDYPGKFRLRTEVFDGTVDYISPWAEFKSITSLQYQIERQALDNDRLTYQLNPYAHDIVVDTHRDNRDFTQEFNVSSLPGGAIDWLVGGFYLNVINHVNFLEYTGVTPTTPLAVRYDTSVLPYIGFGFETASQPQRRSWSGFGETTWHALDFLDLTGGVRYTDDRISSAVSTYFSPIHNIEQNDHAFTGRVIATVKVAPSNTVYASYSTGYKPGASNLVTSQPLIVPQAAKAETITAYEIGSKNEFLDGSLRANLAAFYYDFDNFQYAAEDPIPFSGGVANIPNVRIHGVEAELSALLPDGFRLNGNFAWEEGRINSHLRTLDPVVAANISNTLASQGIGYFDPRDIQARAAAATDVYGNAPPKLPKFTVSADISNTAELGEWGVVTSRLELVYRTGYEYRIFSNSSLDRVPASTTLNLNIHYQPTDSKWNFTFLISNLFDRTNVVSRFTNSFGVETTSQEFAPPRQVIASVGYTF